MFRDRPLTWLFIIATVLLDGVLVSNLLVEQGNSFLFTLSFMLAQGAAVGAWLALGRWFRMTRGVVFLALQVGLAGFTYIQYSPMQPENCWGRMVAAFSLYGAGTFLAALLGRILMSQLISKPDVDSGSMRFSLIELFGWTIIVAIGCVVMRSANFSVISRLPGLWLFHLGSATVAGFWAALFLSQRGFYFSALVLAGLIEGFFFLLGYEYIPYFSAWIQALGVFQLYIALWLLVQRMDFARQSAITQASVDD